MDLILQGEDPAALGVIDIGAGRSRLADGLIRKGCSDVTLLDVSQVALSAVEKRLVGAAHPPRLICASVTHWVPERTWTIWHDRAVFHFLTQDPDRQAYIRAMTAATEPGSRVVMATFAEDGPQRCSGLPVVRYDADTMIGTLGDSFALCATRKVDHVTPTGTKQSFRFFVFNRR
ncbi:MAG: class I SAM-dependent methyltransferase [Ruegeria sp.]